MTNNSKVYISQLKDNVGKEVTLEGWLYNSRASGKIQFIIILNLRTPYSFCLCNGEDSSPLYKIFPNSSMWRLSGAC